MDLQCDDFFVVRVVEDVDLFVLGQRLGYTLQEVVVELFG